MRKLGRLYAPDNRDHPMRLAPPLVPVPASRYWTAGGVLDQGQTSECVAYAWTGWECASPTRDKLGNIDTPDALYIAAQKVDEWAGSPHDGTSVRAGAKIMQSEHRLTEYVFETDEQAIQRWVLTTGPVVFGTNWYEQMFDPTAAGFTKIGGGIAGGHAYLCVGFSRLRRAYRCINSWGTGWGQRGRFWIAAADVSRLLGEQGEACAAVETAV